MLDLDIAALEGLLYRIDDIVIEVGDLERIENGVVESALFFDCGTNVFERAANDSLIGTACALDDCARCGLWVVLALGNEAVDESAESV